MVYFKQLLRSSYLIAENLMVLYSSFSKVLGYLGVLRGILAPSSHCYILIEIPLAIVAVWENDPSIDPEATVDSKILN